AWIKPTQARSFAHIAGKRTGCGSPGGGTLNYQIYLGNGTASAAGVLSFASDGGAVASAYRPPLGQWAHVAAVYDGTNLVLYANGSAVLTRAYTLGGGTNGASLKIGTVGSCAGSQSWVGSIDEVRLWKQARSQAEVQGTMASCVADTAAGL